MKRRISVVLFVFLVLISSISIVEAARTIPASNETSTLSVQVSASAVGGLRARTDMVFEQGNGDLRNNPPLDPNGEGVAVIGYQEHTMATSGSIHYDKDVNVDTGNQIDPANNLDVARVIDYSSTADGEDDGGMMFSTESVSVTEYATPADSSTGCCPWGFSDTESVLPATNDQVVAGSDVWLSEGQVASDSSARTVAASVEEPVELTYAIEVGPSGQTNDESAQGTATAYVDARIMEGSAGNTTAQATDMSYEQTTTVRGLVDLAMTVSYSSA